MHSNKLAPLAYLAGLGLFGLSFFLPGSGRPIGFLAATALAGYHIVIEGVGETITDSRAQHKFAPNIHILMFLAALGAILIGSFEEAALLILIFAGAHFLEEYAEGKSQREITALLDLNPVEARRYDATGAIEVVPVGDLAVGDRLQVLNGGQVPTDGTIIKGTATLNEAAITGESIPQEKTVDAPVFGSTINGDSTFEMVVTKDAQDTVFAKILQLVQESQQSLGKTATKIKRFEPLYVTTVLVLLPVVFLVGVGVIHWSVATSIYRTIVFLISASPCALAAAAVPATLSGLSNLARHGVLFKGGAYLNQLAELQAVAFDKTGTLTAGQPMVTDVAFTTGANPDELVNQLVAMERQSNHPLATAIVAHFTPTANLDITVTNQLGRGLESQIDGQTVRIGKPTSFTAVPHDLQRQCDDLAAAGKTVIFVAVDDQVQGLIALMDVPNPASKAAIDYFKRQRIHTQMITGDAQLTGQAVGAALGVDEVAANVLPENKATIIDQQKQRYATVAMVGDGVNDAPALVKADIGVAMGDGTDVAIDVADTVLMQNDLSKLTYAHRLSKRLNQIIWTNLIFALAIVVLLIVLNFLSITNIAWGVVVHEGSTLLVILNGLRLLMFK
ncbi:heavy metal translocating P-type ATPase [Levilactobacillus acidifarinae]|uniref:Heavy metal-transporting ATPase n=1 Tax=Levilactobacillus acidifarinae DSM 19394 = JCM 15949 TaxID=1423715 RepID=A0A0R1LPY5_9LACO|nr:heavy metal translocating P-type ATPase [Levilactobacillus acidifarinae]KRK94114.1 heavy metal-transporting ATPase [Levilactobacillus acidifarinae DSM 19394]GEO69718.1 metal-transporting ATPase [Levilactobacillus acidifarinae]